MAINDNIIGVAMQLDVSDLKSGLNETKKAITTANKTFQSQTAGMDDWTKTSDGLNAKLTQLDTVLDMQKRNLRGYEAEIKRVSALEGDHTEQLRRLNDKLLDCQTAIGKTEKAQRKYRGMLDQVEDGTKDVTKATDKMSRSMKDAEKSTVDLKGGFSVLKGAMANLVSTGVTSLVSGLKQAVEESRELRKETSRLETAFLDNGFTSEQATASFVELNKVLGDTGRTTEALQLLSTMSKTEGELQQYTDILGGVYAKFGDALPVESLAEAMNHTAKLGEVQGTLADALEWVGINVDDFNGKLAKCSSEEERAKLIRDTLNGVYKDASDTYKENNKSLIEAQETETEYALAQAELGEKMEPVLTTIKKGWTDVLKAFTEMMSGTDLEGLKKGISDAFGWFIKDCVPVIKDAIKFVIDHKELVLGMITAIGVGFLAWKVVGIITSVVGAIKGMITAMASLNAVMMANPIGLIITAIGLLVVAFIYLWNNCDAFREFWIGLWEAIKKYAKIVIDWLTGAFSKAWEFIKKAWSGTVEFFQNIWSGIKKAFSNVVSGISKFFSDAWNKVTGIWKKAGNWFSDIIDDIIGFFADLPEKMLKIGEDMINGLIDGIKNTIGSVGDAIKEGLDAGISTVKGWLGIASPSKLMRDEIGMMMGEGVGDGLLASTKGVIKDAQRFTQNISAGLQGTVGNLQSGTVLGSAGGYSKSVTNNFYQTINAPKQPSRIELYRQTKNLLALRGGY